MSHDCTKDHMRYSLCDSSGEGGGATDTDECLVFVGGVRKVLLEKAAVNSATYALPEVVSAGEHIYHLKPV